MVFQNFRFQLYGYETCIPAFKHILCLLLAVIQDEWKHVRYLIKCIKIIYML